MIGVFLVAKIKPKKKYNPKITTDSADILNSVTMSQSYYYLQFIFDKIHDKIDYQIVDLIDL